MKKILVVVTNVSKYPNQARATGLWLAEAVHFVEEVTKAGYEVDYVSPKGGYTPLDPHSLQADQMSELDWSYYTNPTFLNRLGTTMAASEVDASEYDAIYYTGGHGVMWDFPEDAHLQKLASAIYEKGGVVAAVCHGSVGLLNIQTATGDYLIKDKKVTGFTNTEEQAVGLTEVVPFLTEDALKERGGQYVKSDDWASFALADERVVSGQNPSSGAAVAKEVIQYLEAQ
ncbi:type 1 glutamine amidotransferase domain-containing protein [Kurthia gibsonii]|uniref:type 1 glutamine amidotransferase domain-containing protein n=1 Tax=Kurthia gibsonii TaxID=33946 RepID=UPI002DBDD97D|nr:type 1 glutamine amidotransferase domain-containing protein [Kurthia gibsonii]MEB7773153.1 type 1 glutamine amidotransferase domain-containing protein [Kurthia gibsonii]